MGVTEYIGARYVPVFADPEDWNNTRTYEPLTIVLHQGNSYTSKQFVPRGIDITDSRFWAETGNYNAQVEAYRQEVLTFDARINERAIAFDTVADMKSSTRLYTGAICHTSGFHDVGDGGAAWYEISSTGTANEMDVIACGELFANLIIANSKVTPKMYGAYGDNVHDDTNAIQKAFDSNYFVFIQKGVYLISSSINILHDCSIECDSEAVIKANTNIDKMFNFGGGEVTSTNPILPGLIKIVMNGGIINCNALAEIGIDIVKLYGSEISNVSIVNATNIGVRYSGSFGAGAVCNNVKVRGLDNNFANYGFYINRNDQRLFNCETINCIVGYRVMNAYIRLHSCSAWVATNHRWTETVGYEIKAGYSLLDDCTVDTLNTGVLIDTDLRGITINDIFWEFNTGVLSDYTGMCLFKANSENDASIIGVVNCIQAESFIHDCYIAKNILNNSLFRIYELITGNDTHVLDAYRVYNADYEFKKLDKIGTTYTKAIYPTITEAGRITDTIELPAGVYIATITLPYITAANDAAIRIENLQTTDAYTQLNSGWNGDITRMFILTQTANVYVSTSAAFTHQNNVGNGFYIVKIK